MKNLQDKVNEFFKTRPKLDICYSALGVVFSDKEKAQKYLKGVSGRTVVTHTKDGVQHERPSDELRYKIADQENKVNESQLAYEDAKPIDKEKAMSTWKKEQELLLQLNSQLAKQLKREEKDELIAKEEKETTIDPNKKPTKEQIASRISAQEELIKGTEELLANTKLKPGKRKDAEKVLKGQQSELEKLQAKLKEFDTASEEVITEKGDAPEVVAEENTGAAETADENTGADESTVTE